MKLALMENGIVDLDQGPNGLLAADTIETAVIVSLLTDRRAEPDDILPDGTISDGYAFPDRKGWAGDALSTIANHRIGSRLWLLVRAKQTEETKRRAIFYARESLEWLIEDGHSTAIDITGEWSSIGRLELLIVIYLKDGSRLTKKLSDITGAIYAI